jgi:guanine nucleotide-binding protein G(i) subunit alpha
MQLIHGAGYNSEERESFKEIVFSNIIQSMKVILEAMKVLKIDMGSEENQKYAGTILELPPQVQ